MQSIFKISKCKSRICGINQLSIGKMLNVIYQHSILAGIPLGNFEKILKIAAPEGKTRSFFFLQMLKKGLNFAQHNEKPSQGSPGARQSQSDGQDRSCLPFKGTQPCTVSVKVACLCKIGLIQFSGNKKSLSYVGQLLGNISVSEELKFMLQSMAPNLTHLFITFKFLLLIVKSQEL